MNEEAPAGDQCAETKEDLVNAPNNPQVQRSIPTLTFPTRATLSSGPELAAPAAAQPRASVPSLLGFHLQQNKIVQFAVIATILAAGFWLCIALAFWSGRSFGRKAALRASKPPVTQATPPPEFPAAALPEFDSALVLLRKGGKSDALKALEKLLKAHPDAPSLHYATAFAAMQAGYPREANNMANASISRGFRISDSLSLKAASVAVQSPETASERETLLKRAIATDPMNPNPLLELASLYRYQQQTELAERLLESASTRLSPVDAKTVIETTLAIMKVDRMTDLPAASPPLGIPSRDFPNAYTEMKRGNLSNAANILRYCRGLIDRQLFDYLMRDPIIRKFESRPEMAEFY